MDRRNVTALAEAEVADHPAVTAWRAVSGWSGTPSHVIALKAQTKPSHKSGVYRLAGLGSGMSRPSLIAKRALRTTAELERFVRRKVLAQLSLPRLEEYGFLAEPQSGYCWSFLEDAGDTGCSPGHCTLAARWLGTLHREASRLDLSSLPDRGPTHYVAHLEAGRSRIADCLQNRSLSACDRAMLDRLLRHCDVLAERWNRVELLLHDVPRTLAHGDFVAKNLRVRQSEGSISLYVLDWETAGWAPPVADLSESILRLAGPERESVIDCYRGELGSWWPEVRGAVIEQAAQLGLLFRLIASIRWASEGLPYEWIERPIHKFRAYEERLSAELKRLGWEKA